MGHYSNEDLRKQEEMTTCEVADSLEAYLCITEEQCDDCFMIDHQKECGWCTQYDHTIRKLIVKHEYLKY